MKKTHKAGLASLLSLPLGAFFLANKPTRKLMNPIWGFIATLAISHYSLEYKKNETKIFSNGSFSISQSYEYDKITRSTFQLPNIFYQEFFSNISNHLVYRNLFTEPENKVTTLKIETFTNDGRNLKCILKANGFHYQENLNLDSFHDAISIARGGNKLGKEENNPNHFEMCKNSYTTLKKS